MTTTLKTKVILSAFSGMFVGILCYLVWGFIFPYDENKIMLLTGPSFGLVLFFFLVIHEKVIQKKYSRLEAAIPSPVFFQANGNLDFAGRVRNSNIYFCEDRIILALLDEKPAVIRPLSLQDIAVYRFDDHHFEIHTKDGQYYRVTTPQAPMIRNALRQRGWIV